MNNLNVSDLVSNIGARYFLVDNTSSVPSVLSLTDELTEVSTADIKSVPIAKDSVKELRTGLNRHGSIGLNNEQATMSIFRQISDGKYAKAGTSTYDRINTWFQYAKNHQKAVSNTKYLVEILEPSAGDYEGTLVAVSISNVAAEIASNSLATYNVELTVESDAYPLSVTHVAAVGTTAESFTISVIDYPTETPSSNP